MSPPTLPPAHELARRDALTQTLAAEVGTAQARALARRAFADALHDAGAEPEAVRHAMESGAYDAAAARLQSLLVELVGGGGEPAPEPLDKRLRSWAAATLPPGPAAALDQHIAAMVTARGPARYEAVAWIARRLRDSKAPAPLAAEVAAERERLRAQLPDLDDCRRCLAEVRSGMTEGSDTATADEAVALLGPVGAGARDAATLGDVRAKLQSVAYPIGRTAALAQELDLHLARLHRDGELG